MPPSASSGTPETPAAGRRPIRDETASFVRRLSAIFLGAWLGAILMVALAAPAAFRSVDVTLKFRTPLVSQAIKALGEAGVHDLLRYQVGEANRQIFELWGTIQVIFGAVVFFLLLFFSHVRRLGLGVSLAMLLLSAAMDWLLIPTIVETGRKLHTAQGAQAQAAAQNFRALHTAFSTFEATVAVLGVLLLVLLLRRRHGGRTSHRSHRLRSDAQDA